MKQCKKCCVDKDVSEFYKGHARCKECYKAIVISHRASNKEYYINYDKNRANLPHRVAARKAYSETDAGKLSITNAKKKWASINPIKRGADILVNNAVRDGRLIKSSCCQSCGKTSGKMHGHHDDYAYPMVVRWLCPSCHSK